MKNIRVLNTTAVVTLDRKDPTGPREDSGVGMIAAIEDQCGFPVEGAGDLFLQFRIYGEITR